ncbi:MAG: hypothetical protein EXS35_05860 [Pedosphaera sp.]|nr:hypothetical protein [Pedosphaera sp.]
MKTKLVVASLFSALTVTVARADGTPQELPLVQDWSATNLISTENDWSGVPGFMGYRGDKLVPKPGVNPQTVTADGAGTPVSILANQKNPNTLRTGGLAEFDTLADPVVAFKGSATAGAPSLVLNLTTNGKKNIAVGYKLRDIDGAVNNAVQAVAFQYRVNTNATYTDIPSAFAPDASTGPSLATLMTPIVALLPSDTGDQPLVQVRWITTNSDGNDEWIGIDDITVIGDALAGAPAAAASVHGDTNRAPVKSLRSPRDLSNQ